MAHTIPERFGVREQPGRHVAVVSTDASRENEEEENDVLEIPGTHAQSVNVVGFDVWAARSLHSPA